MKNYLNKRKSHILKYICWLILFIGGICLINDQLFTLDVVQIIDDLRVQPLSRHLIFFVLGLLTVSAATIYDFILCHDFHIKINPSEIFKISWIADIAIYFAEDHTMRKGGLRYALYKSEGVEAKKASIVSSIKDIFILGDESKLPSAFKINATTRIKLILGFIIKWLAAGLFFFYIIYTCYPEAKFIETLAIFFIAMMIGNLSLVPYGMGIFDIVVIYLFAQFGVPAQVIVLPLILFRLFFTVTPWALTMIILSQGAMMHKAHKLSPDQRHLINLMSTRSLAALIFFAGSLLVFSASIPENINTLFALPEPLSLIVVQFSRIFALGIGLLLIVLSKGLWDKISSAYYITLFLLIIGAFFSFLKGFHYEIALVLIIIALALKPTKEVFYRQATRVNTSRFFTSLAWILVVCILYTTGYRLLTGNPLNILTLEHTTLHLGATLLLLLFIIIAALLLNVLSAAHVAFNTVTPEELDKLKLFLKKYKGNSMTHLIFLEDKSLFFCMDDQVLIAFRPCKDKLIVLGDPIGNPSLFKEAINAFRLYADQYDMTPVFYEINEDFLPIYHENGFKFLKLGEEAVMDLSEFTLIGKRYAQLRTIKNKMNRGEFTFELLQNPIDPAIMDNLRYISDLWLEGRREKEFSLGSFDENYINLAPVAIVKQDNEITAFATIMPMYDPDTISIDLMRLVPDPPNGTMDALFVGIIEWAIEQGYKGFVLGKAPLSNVGYNQFSPTKEKVVKYIYQYGNKIYSFKGLRRYKEKYHPNWKGIYLAYPKSNNLYMSLIQLTKMISGTEDK